MPRKPHLCIKLLIVLLIAGEVPAFSQTVTSTLPSLNRTDTSKTNTKHWHSNEAVVAYTTLYNGKPQTVDSAIHCFGIDNGTTIGLGNTGSPTTHLVYENNLNIGARLGYTLFDRYLYALDSLPYFNVNRPYSIFSYSLGSKLEQKAGISFTQNISPRWNFFAGYNKIYSPGFFKINRNIVDKFCLTTVYNSKNLHYTFNAGVVYNYAQHDENGGSIRPEQIDSALYNDRRTIDVAYQNSQYSQSRSAITNNYKNYGIVLQSQYRLGKTEKTFNTDSTAYTLTLKPQATLLHTLRAGSEVHIYKDLAPDSVRYVALFNTGLPHRSSAYYTQGQDSVYTHQQWKWIDNLFALSKEHHTTRHTMQWNIGMGARYDQFITSPAQIALADSFPKMVYVITDKDIKNYYSGYAQGSFAFTGDSGKGAHLQVNGQYYALGNFKGNGALNLAYTLPVAQKMASFTMTNNTAIQSVSYSLSQYKNKFVFKEYAFDNTLINHTKAELYYSKINLHIAAQYTLMRNYCYINSALQFVQHKEDIGVPQFSIAKLFKIGHFVADNSFYYQPIAPNSPLNLPEWCLFSQWSYENYILKKSLKVATGIAVQYNSRYAPAGYAPVYGQYYYQNEYSVQNAPLLKLFFNCSLKHFMGFIQLDEAQQFFAANRVLATGDHFNGSTNSDSPLPLYYSNNATFRFGFRWTMID